MKTVKNSTKQFTTKQNKKFNLFLKRILHSVQDDAIRIKCTNVYLEYLLRAEVEFSLLVIHIYLE